MCGGEGEGGVEGRRKKRTMFPSLQPEIRLEHKRRRV